MSGIIPACAGNTRCRVLLGVARRDHPRVCGEHFQLCTLDTEHQGSSPRVRGTLYGRYSLPTASGIIPACAGNTHRHADGYRHRGDHPRVCGEHKRHHLPRSEHMGSSPRVRGTRDLVAGGGHLRGIIPACAGNTTLSSIAASNGGDHPRVCGEHGISVWPTRKT